MNRKWTNKVYYLISLITILVLFFILLENKYPYYFLQDDNRDGALPQLVHNYRSLTENKEIALFNFHQFLGSPYLATGQPAVLYPFGYIAVFLSNVIYGHYFAAIDILVFLHLIIGCLGFYCLLKLIDLGDKAAFFGAITWPLTSFTIYVSSSWWHVSAVAAYFPWMIFFSLRLIRKPKIGIIIPLVAVRLLLFYTGQIQYFIYAVIFDILTFMFILIGSKLTSKNYNLPSIVRCYLLSYIFTLIFSLPLLLPMWHQTTISALRNTRLTWDGFSYGSYNVFLWFQALLYPFSKKYSSIPTKSWINNALPYLSHIGYIAIIFLILSLVIIIRGYIKNRFLSSKSVYIFSFFVVSFISFIWTIGLFNHLLYNIPILNRFRWSFRLNILTIFSLITLASYGLSMSFKKIHVSIKIKNIIFIFLMVFNIANFFYLYLSSPQKSFRIHLDKIPLEEPLLNVIHDGRIISIGYKFQDQYFANGICYNYATLLGMFHFAGYDPLRTIDNSTACLGMDYIASYDNKSGDIPLDYFQNWGVKWYIVSSREVKRYNEYFKDNDIVSKFEDENRIVYYNKRAKPFFYWQSNQETTGIEYSIKSNTIYIKTRNDINDTLKINFLSNPFFRITIDSREVNIVKRKLNQMAIFIPKGRHNIVLKYRDPYFLLGVYIAFIFLISFITYYLYRIYKVKKQNEI